MPEFFYICYPWAVACALQKIIDCLLGEIS